MQVKYSALKGVQSVLIYGYGTEGKTSEEFLRLALPKASLDIYDDYNKKYSKKRKLYEYDMVVVSPGVDRRLLTDTGSAKITSNVELFFELLSDSQRKKVVGITGTKGKSTTVKFLHELLQYCGYRAQIGGNYGVGVLSLLQNIDALDYLVLELSSFQLENLTESPHYAGFVSFFEDHLDRHGDRDGYFAAKANIFIHQKEGDLFFISEKYEDTLEPAYSIFHAMANDEEGRTVVCSVLPVEYFSETSMMRAEHMRANLGIAAEIARNLLSHDSIIEQKIREFCSIFQPLEHRLEFVREVEGRIFVNDSQSTNQYSVTAALKAFGDKVGCLILGGKDKGNDYQLLVDDILLRHPFVVLLRTEVGEKLHQLFDEKRFENYSFADDFAQAVSLAYQMTDPGKICLLSPAGASLDWFVDYKDRGNQFKQLVSRL